MVASYSAEGMDEVELAPPFPLPRLNLFIVFGFSPIGFPNNSRLCNTGYLFSLSSFLAFLVRAWRLHSIGRGNMGV